MSSFKAVQRAEGMNLPEESNEDFAYLVSQQMDSCDPNNEEHMEKLTLIVKAWIPAWRQDGLTMFKASIDQAERDEQWENKQLNIDEDILMETRGHIIEFLTSAAPIARGELLTLGNPPHPPITGGRVVTGLSWDEIRRGESR